MVGLITYRTIVGKNLAIDRLREKPTEELTTIVTDIYQKLKTNPAKVEWTAPESPLPTNERYVASAALDILMEREGLDFALPLVGMRPPRTFGERIRAKLFNQYPLSGQQ